MHRLYFITDLLIAVGLIGCGVVAIYSFWDRQSTSDIHYFTVYSNETAINRRWDIMVVYTTNDVFGARSTLNVTAVANVSTEPKYSNAWIYFPTSTNVPPRYEGANRLPANIELKFVGLDPTSGAYQFKGNTTLTYPTGGKKVIEFWEAYQKFVYIDGKQEQEIIEISSEDSKYQYETNKATLALTWVVAGLTVVIFRGFIKDFVEDFKWKRGGQKTRRQQEDTGSKQPV